MAAQIVPFATFKAEFEPWQEPPGGNGTLPSKGGDEPRARDWSQQEIAEFYRVESALVRAGLSLETDRGLSDEGDPWYAFCRSDTGEVFIHFARIGGRYFAASQAFPETSSGKDFSELVRSLISRHQFAGNALPFVAGKPGSNVWLHPAALLIALVGAAFFHSSSAKAAELAHAAPPAGPNSAPNNREVAASAAPLQTSVGSPLIVDAYQAAAVIGAALSIDAADQLPPQGPDNEPEWNSPASTAVTSFSPPAIVVAPTPAVDHQPDVRAQPFELSAALSGQAKALVVLAAILGDLNPSPPGPGSLPSVSSATYGGDQTVPSPVPVNPARPFHPTISPDRAVILVHFDGGSLPSFEAAQVVETSGALAYISMQLVGRVNQLPAALQALLSRGRGDADSLQADGSLWTSSAHLNLDDSGSSLSVGDKSAAAKPPVQPQVIGVTDTSHTEVSQTAVSQPVAAPSPAPAGSQGAPPASPSHVYGAHDPHVAAAVLHFAVEVANLDVLISGRNLVLYDAPALSSGHALDSVTYNFDDGSAVSLIGTVQELASVHTLA